MIRTQSLSMNYGPLRALSELNLDIPQGELFAFLGPNAAGKTTTIKLLTGLLVPTQGQAWLCGHNVQEAPLEAKRCLGFVPDVAVFYDKLTSIEFMEFISEVYEMDHTKARQNTGQLFEQFSLRAYANEQIEHLSHGTRQRLAIAASLMHDPKVIIIDEPMVGLDPVHVRVVKDELKARTQQGVTVFMSTHLLNIAEELADRIGIIHGGQLVAQGTLSELKRDCGHGELEAIFLSLLKEPGDLRR